MSDNTNIVLTPAAQAAMAARGSLVGLRQENCGGLSGPGDV